MADKVTVIGAGTMGSGIAQVALEAGFQVILVDTEARFFERGINSIRKFIAKKVEKGKITQEKYDETVSRLSGTTDIAKAVAGAVMVVEAVFESLDLKKDIFRKIDAAAGPDTVMASNTSTLSISKIAAAVSKPGRVIGTHYFSPVPLMRLVEVIRGTETSEDTVNRTMELCRKFGKTPVLVKDIPGFIVNRFLCLLYNEAANMIHDGIAKPEEIDTALKLGCNWPMGVNEIMDLAGVDVCGLAMEAMYEMTGEERYKPSPLFRKMMAENLLGRKSGKGFYEYNK